MRTTVTRSKLFTSLYQFGAVIRSVFQNVAEKFDDSVQDHEKSPMKTALSAKIIGR